MEMLKYSNNKKKNVKRFKVVYVAEASSALNMHAIK